MNKASRVAIVILAAGEGKRMNSTLPKVLHLIQNKPLVDHVVTAAEKSGVADTVVVVVNNKHELVQEYLQNRVKYAVQAEQRGTGHAVQQTNALLKDRVDTLIVLYGDMPCIRPESIQRLLQEHKEKKNMMTLMTVTVKDFHESRRPLYSFSRIIRNSAGAIIKDVQMKDASEKELQEKELNTCFFCFDADWLWKELPLLTTQNAQQEYYLTDLVARAIETNVAISSVPISVDEARGINSQEDLQIITQP